MATNPNSAPFRSKQGLAFDTARKHASYRGDFQVCQLVRMLQIVTAQIDAKPRLDRSSNVPLVCMGHGLMTKSNRWPAVIRCYQLIQLATIDPIAKPGQIPRVKVSDHDMDREVETNHSAKLFERNAPSPIGDLSPMDPHVAIFGITSVSCERASFRASQLATRDNWQSYGFSILGKFG